MARHRLVSSGKKHPSRFFDRRIAGLRVTFAAGLAIPGCARGGDLLDLLQRAYDQIIHRRRGAMPAVTFCLDRAGRWGPTVPTHHGVFRPVVLRAVPNFIIAAPRTGTSCAIS